MVQAASQLAACFLILSITGSKAIFAGDSCTREKLLIDRVFETKGGYVNNGTKEITGNNWDCCRLCNEKPACRAWVRVKHNEGSSKWGECWLIDHIPTSPKNATWADCGKKFNSPCSSTIELNSRRTSASGQINKGNYTITNSDEECCQLCRDQWNCYSWTRYTNTTKTRTAGECWMRNWAPDKKKCNNCNSGLVDVDVDVDLDE
ncbi:hypothetical protein BSKO_00315 [Bryopsis sp. KO-2023]|nr:hypothetical protein BSKO_00315 [Bryopsis sp. KO-2023]